MRHFGSPLWSHQVELDSVDERVVIDGPGVRRASPERLTIDLTRCGHVVFCDGRERQHLEGIDLDDDSGSAVPAADLDLLSAPQPDRDGDLAPCNRVAKVSAEHHPDTLRRLQLRSTAALRGERVGGEPVLEYDDDLSTVHISDSEFALHLRWGERGAAAAGV